MTANPQGPDLVLAGTARSGTSALAAQLAIHPDIDPGAVKEPNYFSRHLDRGPEWYEDLFQPRREGLLRLDASTSYTSSVHPDAISNLAAAAPHALVIYAVRQPTQRALSHYLLRHHLFQIEDAATFGEALSATTQYVDTSDYSRWLPALSSAYGKDKLLVVPFEVITSTPHEATSQICRLVGLSPPPQADEVALRHRNDVVQYRSQTIHLAARRFRQSSAYPWLRALLGGNLARSLRGLVTQQPQMPDTTEAMASCSAEQLADLAELDARAGVAVWNYLQDQDDRLGLDWAARCFAAPA